MTRHLHAIVALCGLLGAIDAPAAAQSVYGSQALVAAEAPVYLLPDPSRTPLRSLTAGTPLTLLDRKGEWLQVTFEDRQLGRRTGWIETRFVRIRPAGADPLAADTPAGAPTEPGAAAPPDPGRRQAPASRPAPRAARGSSAPGARLFGSFAATKMSASQSFDAVTGADVVRSFGGGVQFTNLWRGLFAEGAVNRRVVDGERVFAVGEEVFPLGIPVKLTLMPVDAVLGWRMPMGRVVPYVGGGMTFFKYEETSDFADADENIDKWHRGFVVMGGVEVTVMRWVHLRGDLRYRQVNDALGIAGVSEVFDEDRLGGFGAGVHLVVGR